MTNLGDMPAGSRPRFSREWEKLLHHGFHPGAGQERRAVDPEAVIDCVHLLLPSCSASEDFGQGFFDNEPSRIAVD